VCYFLFIWTRKKRLQRNVNLREEENIDSGDDLKYNSRTHQKEKEK